MRPQRIAAWTLVALVLGQVGLLAQVTKEVKKEEMGSGSVRETVVFRRAGEAILVRERRTNPEGSAMQHLFVQQVLVDGKQLLALTKSSVGMSISSPGRAGLSWSMGNDKRTGEAQLLVTRADSLEVVELFNITKEGLVPASDDELQQYRQYMGRIGESVDKLQDTKETGEIKDEILRIRSLTKELQAEPKP